MRRKASRSRTRRWPILRPAGAFGTGKPSFDRQKPGLRSSTHEPACPQPGFQRNGTAQRCAPPGTVPSRRRPLRKGCGPPPATEEPAPHPCYPRPCRRIRVASRRTVERPGERYGRQPSQNPPVYRGHGRSQARVRSRRPKLAVFWPLANRPSQDFATSPGDSPALFGLGCRVEWHRPSFRPSKRSHLWPSLPETPP